MKEKTAFRRKSGRPFLFVKRVSFVLHQRILLVKGFPLRGSWRQSRLMRWQVKAGEKQRLPSKKQDFHLIRPVCALGTFPSRGRLERRVSLFSCQFL